MNIIKYINKKIKKILISINIKKKHNYKITSKDNFGDYQINGIINIAKKEKKNKLLNIIKKKLKKITFIKKIEIKQPGFVNIFIKKKKIENLINSIFEKKNFGIKKKKKIIIIDYSSPNIAKEMHIGHLRSSILGDSIANILEFLGNKVIRINHIGDWGAHFGMLIAFIKKKKIKNINNLSKLELIYKKAQKMFLENKNFAKKSRKYVRKLQHKKNKIIKIWKKIVKLTINENQKIYNNLNIKLNNKNIIGESFYQNMIPEIINILIKKKIAIKDKKTIFIPSNKKKNKEICMVIKNKAGNYLYSSVDITSIMYRCKYLKAQKIIYLTDFRQKQYFQTIFNISKKALFIKKTKLIHCYFGAILKENNKPIKTRKGNNIKLKTLIKKSIIESKKIIKTKKKNINYISKKISIGVIKYTDLRIHRKKNYIFNWKRMLSYQGNTSLYIQYGYTRITSILKKNNTNITKSIKKNKIYIYNRLEKQIIKKILNFPNIIKISAQKYTPHLICNFLYELTVLFSRYYETNYINNIQNITEKNSKLKLIAIIAKTTKIGLSLLGISTLQKI